MASSINASTTAGVVTTADTSGVLNIQTAGTTAISIDASQAVTMAGRTSNPTTISVGAATPSTSGAGITFPATQSASTDANTLDDYEEGTWTPSLGGTTTYSTQSGTYTKVGRLVFIRGVIVVTTIGTGSTTNITGLPFANASEGVIPISVGSFFSTVTSVVSFFAQLTNGGSTITVYSLVAVNTTEQSNAIFKSGTQFQFSGCYNV
jgi:hypothetical protein